MTPLLLRQQISSLIRQYGIDEVEDAIAEVHHDLPAIPEGDVDHDDEDRRAYNEERNQRLGFLSRRAHMLKAHEILNHESKWTRRAFARTPSNCNVVANHRDACCWCLDGILEKVYGNFYDDSYRNALARVKDAMERLFGIRKSVWCFNDDPHTTFDMIHSVLVEADV